MRKRSIKALLFFNLLTLPFSLTSDPWKADEYHLNSSSQKNAASDLLRYVSIQNDWTILDVGCGDGKITAELSKKAQEGRVVGLDISPAMIGFAKEHYQTDAYPNLEFVIGDALQIDYHNEFDAVLSFTTLQWIGNHELFIREAYQALKPVGVLAVTMPMGLPATLQQAVMEAREKPEWSPYFIDFSTGWNFPEENSYTDFLTKNGFILSRLEVVPQLDIFPSRAVFEKFIGQWFPYLRPLPEALKSVFLKEVLDRYISLNPSFPNGEVHFKVKRLEAVASKG